MSGVDSSGFQTKNPCRLAIIGAGRWGRNLIHTAISTPGVSLVAVGSENTETTGLVPQDCVVDNWRRVVSLSYVEAVVIATPPDTHRLIAEAALSAGKHVLIEKPLAITAVEADLILRMAAKTDLIASVEFTQLSNPKFRALLRELPSIGEIRAIKTVAGNYGPIRSDTPVIHDWGVHELSIAFSICGNSVRNTSGRLTNRTNDSIERQSNWEAVCEFETGVRAVLTFGNMMPRCRRVAVFGDLGTLTFDDYSSPSVSIHPPHPTYTFPTTIGTSILVGDTRTPLEVALTEFASDIRSKEKSLKKLQMGVAFANILNSI